MDRDQLHFSLGFSGFADWFCHLCSLAMIARQSGGWVDRFAVAIASIGAAIRLLAGLLLILAFAVQLAWLPARVLARLPAILPAVTLALVSPLL